jgi:transcriptional regulator with XRE-family HTH domain
MAALAQLADVSASSINQIEKGTNQPRGDTIEKLARVLRVSPSWLMYQEGSKPDWDT